MKYAPFALFMFVLAVGLVVIAILFRRDRAARATIAARVTAHQVLTPTFLRLPPKLEREDRPEFKRTYTVVVGDGFRVEGTMTWRYGRDRQQCGWFSVTQRDGREILFDPDKIADKVIDPKLLPLVEGAVRCILDADRAYASSASVAEFTDEDGITWRRQ